MLWDPHRSLHVAPTIPPNPAQEMCIPAAHSTETWKQLYSLHHLFRVCSVRPLKLFTVMCLYAVCRNGLVMAVEMPSRPHKGQAMSNC